MLPTIVVWRLRRRRLVAGLLFLWIVFAIGWVEEMRSVPRLARIADRPRAEAEDHAIRIVSLNCAGEAKNLVDLRRLHPDVALLQETPGEEQLTQMTADLFGAKGNYLFGGDTAIIARGRINSRFVDRGGHFVAGDVVLVDGREIACLSLRLAPPPAR